MKNIIGIIFIISSQLSLGQGSIDVVQPRGIDILIQKQALVIPPEVRPQIDGYRIQLFFDQEKDAVSEARSKFIGQYPNIETYVEYKAPYHYLKAGDFRTHLDAVRIKSTIEDIFPTSFIVKEKIYLPNLEKDEIK